MADESTIMEMMEEMETYFIERDRLFKEREDAYSDRYEDLLRREASLQEKKEEMTGSWMAYEEQAADLENREKELLKREEQLQKEAALKDEEYSRRMKILKEDQLRLNLLETKLQNESLKQETERLLSRAKKAEISKQLVPVLSGKGREETGSGPAYSSLKEEISRLKEESSRLFSRAVAEMGKRKAVEKEKQELLRCLLAADPETARLFENREKERSVEDREGTSPAGTLSGEEVEDMQSMTGAERREGA